jgi:hypothetical protein
MLTQFILCFFAGLLLLPVAGFGAGSGQQVLGGVKTDKRDYKIGEPVKITFIVENRGKDDAVLRFTSGQRFDMWAEKDGNEVWRWSRGKLFTQALGSITLKPGERATFDATWDQKDTSDKQVDPGAYSVFAQLTTSKPRPTPVQVKFTIGVAPAAVQPATVGTIAKTARASSGKLVQLQGTYLGFKPTPNSPNCRVGQPKTRSDWAFKDLTGCIYVTGIYRLDPVKDVGKKITVSGYVRVTDKGLPYIQGTNMSVKKG